MELISEMHDIQQLELGLLDYFLSVCNDAGLRYFLIGGTLIGAMRHGGFIPWDDDIDIALPRADYDKLLALLRQSHHPRYRLMTIQDGTKYFYEFSKLSDTWTKVIEPGAKVSIPGLGVFMDIYPLDGLGDDESSAQNLFLSVRKKARRIASCANINRKLSLDRFFIRTMRRWLYSFKGRECLFNEAVEPLRAIPFQSEWVASTFGIHGIKDIYRGRVFKSCLKVSFEGRLCCVPSGYEEYLTQRYGNWKELPPENERRPHHTVEIWRVR